jgi:hypothetical protein
MPDGKAVSGTAPSNVGIVDLSRTALTAALASPLGLVLPPSSLGTSRDDGRASMGVGGGSMRKQYHPVPSADGLRVWDVERLVLLAADLPEHRVPLGEISELDEVRWFDGEKNPPTCRAVLSHLRLVLEADTSFPILLGSDGRVMDGMHRVLKVALEGGSEIVARQFPVDPEPDYVGIGLDDLPY